mmetsp:Transcript_102412/g.181863  ORF Transcript_102412/g.181863 Transcript_102412/m.181863 type:complete len:164 (+) Transcript_102412:65-556(+)|eukprot:CAMPEP_0197652008 /NCGR_PEP_ID=MMETSP1338-20131121/34188_1 /TAXON_ID=43686 ORGANISM="Pelagodinium beii, Strain RCC1491" /NCGR_SAMPLE_ID=MMETSP1338 /ASSEMBLY_ACC=CAM_ASM_000754 /LENGTH=163 /DNA_ID=CAMNT_0043226791 /DNA_START=59 /DNA_END=550 /DNA_ORIENTATION=-
MYRAVLFLLAMSRGATAGDSSWQAEQELESKAALAEAGLQGNLRGMSTSSDASNSSSPTLEILEVAPETAAIDESSYWDGQCTPCPAYIYRHCSAGGTLIGERACGTANAYCEGRCTLPPTEAPPSICADNDESCAYWAQQGECSSNPSYMQSECQDSCGLCQ